MNRKIFLMASSFLFNFSILADNKKKKKKKVSNNKNKKDKYDYHDLTGKVVQRKEGLNENIYLQQGNKSIYISSTIHDEVEDFLDQNVTLKAKLNRNRIIAIREIKLASNTPKKTEKKSINKKKNNKN